MDRELVLATLVGLLCGPALLAAGAIAVRLPPVVAARELERRAWRRVWLPLWPPALVLAFLVGWAVQEPESSEGAGPALLAVAAVFGLIALRAAVRAVRALRRPRGAVAMTAGLWRPRAFIAPELAARLDEQALHAALEHEAAHARHRDPLRLWLAQIATDLQWPLAAARRRFADWRNALELARDAEACERVEGSDLAAALIEAARLSRGAAGVVGLVGGAGAFSDRIHRLLDAPPDAAAAPRRGWTWALWLGAVGLAIAAGGVFGEQIIGLLPGFAG
jgi:hypothetical protein